MTAIKIERESGCSASETEKMSGARWATYSRGIPQRCATFLLLATCAFTVLTLQPAGAFGISSEDDIRVNINVPKEAEVGKSVGLECTWKLSSNKKLYSVKWYKDGHEFFSYNPDNEPQSRIKTYSQNGVTIDVRSSNKNFIWLTHLSLNSSGQYRCEVSAGAPTFATNISQANLTIIALPSQGPEINGLSSHYAVGENVTANCTASPSVPKAQLYWTINNKTVPAEYVIEYPYNPIESQSTSNIIGLRMELEGHYFNGSRGPSSIRIRCIARVGSRRFETEKPVQLAQANNQRFSAGDLRSQGDISATYNVALLILATLLVT